jgi:hypothetical protein
MQTPGATIRDIKPPPVIFLPITHTDIVEAIQGGGITIQLFSAGYAIGLAFHTPG